CKSPSVMLGYYEDKEETSKVLKDGWLYTGDYGRLDEDGFLYITGRKKNVIITKNGKNVFPEEVEFQLNQSDYIEESLVHGVEDAKNNDIVIKAEIFPNYELLVAEACSKKKDIIREFMSEVIKEINQEMPLYKQVKRFDLRSEEFEKTTTKKIKRHTAIIEEQDKKRKIISKIKNLKV
ncbi:MAG: hypothetical protein ACRCUS_05095, partial [Anaerovoracaceae bacterium]